MLVLERKPEESIVVYDRQGRAVGRILVMEINGKTKTMKLGFEGWDGFGIHRHDRGAGRQPTRQEFRP